MKQIKKTNKEQRKKNGISISRGRTFLFLYEIFGLIIDDQWIFELLDFYLYKLASLKMKLSQDGASYETPLKMWYWTLQL